MKKFMKALAFATVMCMLLSTVVFAAPEATLDSDYQFDVRVATTEAEQVSLLVVRKDANLNSLQNGEILYVGQEASNGTEAVFADVKVASENDVVDIYAGYASANGPAVYLKGYSVVKEEELTITLGDVEIIPDVTTWEKLSQLTEEQKTALADQLPEREVASMVRAIVSFANFTAANEVSKVGWEFDTSDGFRYAELDATGFNVLEGNVKIGVAFANGWKSDFAETEGYKAPLEIKGINLYFKVDGKSMQATKAAE